MDVTKPHPTAASHPPTGPHLGRRAWHTRAALPMLVWMLALVGVVGGHRFLPHATWLLVHLVTVGIASNAVVVWSNHFADAVLRSPQRGHRREAGELALLNLGLVLLVVGVLGQWRLPVWAGAGCLVAMALVAVMALGRQARRSLPSRFGATVRWYQAAAVCLVAGVVLGGLMAVPYGRWADELLTAHLAFNLLGWIGLTAVGTLTSLWPTILRTQAPASAERSAGRSLQLMVPGVLLTAGANLLFPATATGWRLLGGIGLVCYLLGVLFHLSQAGSAWRRKPATTFAALSTGLAQLWLAGWLGWLLAHQLVAESPAALVLQLRGSIPAVVVGFLLQLVLGALAYLLPVVLGGGPARVRASNAVMERGAVARVATVNLGLLAFLCPIPSLWKVTSSVVVAVALTAYLPLLVRLWRQRRGEPAAQESTPEAPGRLLRGLAWGMAWTLLAAGLAAVADPASFRAMGHHTSAASVSATGRTTQVRVIARDMRFSPAVIDVAAGDRLVLTVVNQDPSTVHDLVLATGATSGRVQPGATATVDAGVVSATTDGWCSVAGHRQMGMTLTVRVSGSSAAPSATASGGVPTAGPTINPAARWPAGFTAREAELPPASVARTHRLTLEVRDTVVEVAPGVRQTLWTFNGTAPGPALRGHVGDTFDITLVNHASMGHSIDFHAGALAPDRPMRTIAPGQRLSYRFTAQRAGIWLYHCSTAPMSLHIANGMFGAVVVDPPDLPRVDREFLLVQSELYLGASGADNTPGVADAQKLQQRRPDAVVFNGRVRQYDQSPLRVTRGQRVRFWVLNAGPDESLPFHVVGAQFDSVWSEGAWRLRDGRTPGVPGRATGGSQALGLLASQGGFVETTFTQAGHYPLVNHEMTLAELGAHGVVEVR